MVKTNWFKYCMIGAVFCLIMVLASVGASAFSLNCSDCSNNDADYWFTDDGGDTTSLDDNGTQNNGDQLNANGYSNGVWSCGNANIYSNAFAYSGSLSMLMDRSGADAHCEAIDGNWIDGYQGLVSWWIYYPAGFSNNAGSTSGYFFYWSSGRYFAKYGGSTNIYYDSVPTDGGQPATLGQWYFQYLNFTGAGTVEYYHDNIKIGTGTRSGASTSGNGWAVNNLDTGDFYFDNLKITFNGTTTFPTIPPDPHDPINLSIPDPNNYAYYNTPIQINLTGNTSSGFANVNGTLFISTDGGAFVSNGSDLFNTGVNKNMNFTFMASSGNYTYYINATLKNGDGSLNYTESTSQYSFIMDVDNPTQTTDFINETVFINKNITSSFNFSDSIGLHTVNFSINGNTITSITDIYNLTWNTTFNYDPSGLPLGWLNFSVYRADGHTAQQLLSPEDYNPSNGLFNDYIQYTFSKPYKPGYIRIKGLEFNIFDTFTTEYKKDRYKIKYKPAKLSSSYAFKVTTSDPITIYNSDRYGGDWLVFGEHWLDFYIPDEPYLNVLITKINDYEVMVGITGINPNTKELNFNSIGDLNIVTEVYVVFNGNATATYEDEIIGGASQTITLNLTTGVGITTDADLIYNGTLRTDTKTSYTGYDLYTATFNTPAVTGWNNTFNFTWNYTVTGPADAEAGHINASNIGFNYQIDNCSNFNTYAINVTFVNITDGTPVAPDITLGVTGDTDYYETWGTKANFSLCVYPPSANISEAVTIQYDLGTSYYYNVDTYLNSDTQLLTLYIQSATETTTFTVKDRNTGENLEDAYATMYRRINGSWTVIEAKYTDITGRVQFGFDETVEYQFFLSKSGYDPYTFVLNPIIFDSYDILMDPTFTTNQTWDYDRIGLLHEPVIFYNDQINNFTFNIHSPYSELIAYSYALVFPGGNSPQTNSGTSPVGEELTSSLNISGAAVGDKVELTYYYETDVAGVRMFTYDYEIIMGGENTMIANRDRTFGMGLFERLFISVFFVLLAVGIATLVGQPIPGFALGLLLYGYFVYIGFIPIWTVLITIAIGLAILGARPEG